VTGSSLTLTFPKICVNAFLILKKKQRILLKKYRRRLLGRPRNTFQDSTNILGFSLLAACFTLVSCLALFLEPEDGGDMFL
jgi:hypothetical protein